MRACVRAQKLMCIHAAPVRVLQPQKSIYKPATKLSCSRSARARCGRLKYFSTACSRLKRITARRVAVALLCIDRLRHMPQIHTRDLYMEVNIIKSIALAIVVYLTRITQQHAPNMLQQRNEDEQKNQLLSFSYSRSRSANLVCTRNPKHGRLDHDHATATARRSPEMRGAPSKFAHNMHY